ncbi:MAG: fatty acid hydroxylase [Cyclobacteriaceae bacterium]|nr:fatty acid hydroxylase [Cyclobacteriaceae bacterium]
MKTTFVSNSTESTRMFKADWMEALSKVHWSVPLWVFVPVVTYFGWKSTTVQPTLLSYIISITAGLLIWSGTEYILHRFVFHFVPDSKWGLRLHFIFHGVHHDYPNDANRLVLPPSVSIPLATGFYFLFAWLIPVEYLYSFFAAFIVGYLCYDISHYALHHANFKSGLWKKMKQHHMTHHYQDPSRGYGVTTKLWDLMLFSDFRKRREEAEN